MTTVHVQFVATIAVECDHPENDSDLAQAVQDEIGHTGACVQAIEFYDVLDSGDAA